MKVKGVLFAIAAAAAATIASAAKADTVKSVTADLSSVAPWGTVHISVNSGADEYVGVGQLQWSNAKWYNNADYTSQKTPAPTSFWTYCIQASPSNDVYTGQSYGFTVSQLELTPDVSLGSNGAAKAIALQHMFGWAADAWTSNGDLSTVTASQAIGLQLAVWEIVYDGVPANPASLGDWGNTGAFKFNNASYSGVDDNTATAAGAAALGQVGNALYSMNLYGLKADLSKSYNGQGQDQAIAFLPAAPDPPVGTPLPASATTGLTLLTLNAIWYWKRRRE